MDIKISGHSDDIIEVEGDISEMCIVVFPSLDVFRVTYGLNNRGVWTVEHETASGKLTVRIDRAPDGDDPEPYTDLAHVSGHIERVEHWTTWPPMADEIRERVEDFFDGTRHCAQGSEGLTDDQVKRIWAIINEPSE